MMREKATNSFMMPPLTESQYRFNHCKNSKLSNGRPLTSLLTSTCCHITQKKRNVKKSTIASSNIRTELANHVSNIKCWHYKSVNSFVDKSSLLNLIFNHIHVFLLKPNKQARHNNASTMVDPPRNRGQNYMLGWKI